MRSRLPLLAVAVLLAGVVTFLIFQQMEGYKRQLRKQFTTMAQGFEPVPVVVAAQDITKRGTVITEEMITVEHIPGRALQPYAVQDPLEVVGKEPLGPVAQGQQFLRNQLVVPGTAGGTLSTKIPSEQRAISLEVDLLSSVSGFIRPSDHVDILWTFLVPGAGGKGEPVTLTLFQNVEVLAVGSQMRAGPASEGAEQAREARTITLALKPHDAELLLFAQQQGRFQLSLRPRSDTAQVALPPTTLEALLQQVLPQQAQPPPAPPAKPPKHVEVIRGKSKEIVTLTPEGAMPIVNAVPAAVQLEEAPRAPTPALP